MGKVSEWFGPLSGVLFVAAVVVGVAISAGVDSEPSDSASSVLAEFREGADDIRTGALLTMLGVGFLLVFVGHLRTRFRDGGAGWAADGFSAGGVVLAGGVIVFTAVQLAGAEAGDNGHAEVAQGAIDFLWNGTLIFSPGLLAVGIAAAVVSFTYRTLPTWLGVFAVVVALGALAPWIGIFVFIAWVLAASIFELIRVSRPATARQLSNPG
ncbi:MAG: hypothetical protein V3S60_07650 [Acidimicrobiia bacterium]